MKRALSLTLSLILSAAILAGPVLFAAGLAAGASDTEPSAPPAGRKSPSRCSATARSSRPTR